MNARQYTDALLQGIEEGLLTSEGVLSELLCYLSEQQVKEFVQSQCDWEEFLGLTEKDEEDEDLEKLS